MIIHKSLSHHILFLHPFFPTLLNCLQVLSWLVFASLFGIYTHKLWGLCEGVLKQDEQERKHDTDIKLLMLIWIALTKRAGSPVMMIIIQ